MKRRCGNIIYKEVLSWEQANVSRQPPLILIFAADYGEHNQHFLIANSSGQRRDGNYDQDAPAPLLFAANSEQAAVR